MKSNIRSYNIAGLSMILTLTTLLASTFSCNELGNKEQFFELIIENQTAQVLTIYLDDLTLGKVEPSAQVIQKNIPSQVNHFLIIAKNEQGEAIFSKTLSRQQMQYIKGTDTFKVVIPPLKTIPESGDNITNE